MQNNMPKTTEIASRTQEMNPPLSKKTIQQIEIVTPMFLNLSQKIFKRLVRITIRNVTHHYKRSKVKTWFG